MLQKDTGLPLLSAAPVADDYHQLNRDHEPGAVKTESHHARSSRAAIGLLVFVGVVACFHWTYLSSVQPTMLAMNPGWLPPQPKRRCDWVIRHQTAGDEGLPREARSEKYSKVATDANTFYRGTARIFWEDFVTGGWGNYDFIDLGSALVIGGSLMRRSSVSVGELH
jgi:hypothetical protein